MPKVSYPIDATFKDIGTQSFFRQRYKSRKGFLNSMARCKKVILIHAVDVVTCEIITPYNIDEYRHNHK